MKSLFTLSTLLFLTLFVSSCDDDDNLCLRGSGQVSDYELTLDNFSSIALHGPVNLMITQGPEQKVVVQAEPELFGPMDYYVRSGKLEIGYINKSISCFDTNEEVWINITVPNLTGIESEGESKVRNTGDLDLPILTIIMAGAADYELYGEIDHQEILSEGSLVLRNFGVESERVDIETEGACEAEVYCTQQLNITVDGAAKVSYKGSPEINQDVEGSLDLIDAN